NFCDLRTFRASESKRDWLNVSHPFSTRRDTRCTIILPFYEDGEISRTATGDAPLPRIIGVPVDWVPQPTRLMTVVFTWPLFRPEAGVKLPSGFRNNWRNPINATGLVGDVPVTLLNTGTVTSESLTITNCPISAGLATAAGLPEPATNSKGAFGGAVVVTVSAPSIALVRQFTASAVWVFRPM